MSKKTSKQHDDKSVTVCNEETNHQPKNQRRALIASIAAAGAVGLPTQWKKPVIDHIMLPAHAQTSPGPASTFTTQVTTSFSVAQTASGIFSCSQDFLQTFVLTSTDGVSSNFTLTYLLTQQGIISCEDPVGGISSSTNGSGTATSTSSASSIPTITSFTRLVTNVSTTQTGTFTSTASMSATTTVTSGG